jgi:dTMP kinase
MGRLIVFEGIDGSGKSTQFKLLCERYERERKEFMRLTFPQYSEPSSALIKMYLAGEFGEDPNAVNAYAASSFFAVDRFASYIKVWRSYYKNGGTIVTDRYTTSNALHQGSKLPAGDRPEFFSWLYRYEFDLMELPKPDIVLYMDISAQKAAQRMRARETATGTNSDIHERDIEYLKKCSECGRMAANHFGWNTISCFDGDRPRSELEIHEEIVHLLASLEK